MPSPYDPSAHTIGSGHGHDASRTAPLQDAHDKAKRLAGIKGQVRADDHQYAALVRALLGINHQLKGGSHGR